MDKNRSMSKRIDISKELENISFKELLAKFPELKRNKKEISKISRHKKLKRWFMSKKVYPLNKKKDSEPKTQLVAFQQAMRLLLIIGQCLGLNPIAGVLVADVSKMRFSVYNWRFLYCITIGLMQAIGTTLILYRLSKIPFSIGAIGPSFISQVIDLIKMIKKEPVTRQASYCVFYITTCITTFMYLYLGTKWPGLMRELVNCSLDEYIDGYIKFKCYTACIVILIFGIVEHILAVISKITRISDCFPDVDLYSEYHRQTFAWYYELGLPDNTVFKTIIQIMNVLSTLNWNYTDVYIICLSFYLVSILRQINKKIMLASRKHFLPPNYWRSLREDYFKATQLIRSFDGVISGIIFSSFASNLFFICLQLFNVLRHGLKSRDHLDSKCKNFKSGIFNGNEYTIYVGYSVLYLLVRSLAVSLIAASVHSTSLVSATALYDVPSTSYCPEVARFLNQVHTDTVALTGLNFFYVTRELVLSVVGTIVTYELVVLQVSEDETEQ